MPMEKLATLYEQDIYPNRGTSHGIEYTDRRTGKAIVLNQTRQVALVGNSQNTFLQLPGGGIDDGEGVEEGVIRECLEEIGCIVQIVDEVGIIDDYRPRDQKHCINYCYVVEVLEQVATPMLTADEIGIGMYTRWVSLKEALSIFEGQKNELKNGTVTFYNTGFNIMRDYLFLEFVHERLETHE